MRAAAVLVAGLVAACGFGAPRGEPDAGDRDAPPGVDAEEPDAEPAGPWLAGYQRRRTITLLQPQVALADFVMAVRLDADADLTAFVDPDGMDLRFVDAAGAVLAFELEAFDAAAGSLAAWVRIPSALAGTRIYLFYGAIESAEPPPRPDAADTWSPEIFRAVWHLSDANEDHADASTPPSIRLQKPGGANAPIRVDGLMARARRFDATDRMRQNGEDDPLDPGADSFSFSVFVNVTASIFNWDIPLYKGGTNAGNPGFDLELGLAVWNACVADAGDVLCATFGDEPTLNGEWHHLVAVVDRTADRLHAFLDGAPAAGAAATNDIAAIDSMDNELPLELSPAANVFSGDLDEVRIYRGALSPAWIAAEHATVMTPAAFARIGAAEAPLP